MPDFIATIAFPVGLMVVGIALVFTHLRARQAAEQFHADGLERGFRLRQFRRRMQTSMMVFWLGVGTLVGQWIPRRDHPTLFVLFWCAILLFTLWLILLALADVLATRVHQGRL